MSQTVNKPKSAPQFQRPGGGAHYMGPKKKAKNQKQTIGRIWHYMQRQRLGMIAAIVFVLFSTMAVILAVIYVFASIFYVASAIYDD